MVTLPHALYNLGVESQELEHNMLLCNKVSSNAHGKKEINCFLFVYAALNQTPTS